MEPSGREACLVPAVRMSVTGDSFPCRQAQQQLAEEGERVEALLRESEALRRELSEVRELTEGAQLRLAAVSTERDEAEAGSRRDRQRANDLEVRPPLHTRPLNRETLIPQQ